MRQPHLYGILHEGGAGAVSIDKCPYFSDDAKAMLNEQTAPPMKTITVGDHKLGGETVLFRHEKTLVNKNLYAVSVCTCMSAEEADKKLADLQKVDYERIGERMYVEFVFVATSSPIPLSTRSWSRRPLLPAVTDPGVLGCGVRQGCSGSRGQERHSGRRYP